MNRHLSPWLLLLAAFPLSACGNDSSSTAECSGGRVLCGEFCADLQSSSANCGQCGHECPVGAECINGACAGAVTCNPGEQNCGGVCVNPQADSGNCGECDNPCPTGTTCQAGSCSANGACVAPRTPCPSGCTDTATDKSNCGGCGIVCDASSVCYNGGCVPSSSVPAVCQAPQRDCGGQCVDTNGDESHCGGCDIACDPGENCDAGKCCGAGQVNCGWCTDLMTDRINCGGCDIVCANTDFCLDGVCTPIPNCSATQENCRGVCVSLTSDNANCGGCGNVCGANLVCQGGQCLVPPTCASNEQLCGAVCTNLAIDNNNCGSCGNACTGGTSCINGACGTGTTLTCTLPALNCGGTVCVDGSTDNANCGDCAVACSGGMTCQSGVCTCPAGQMDCNGDGACDNLQTSASFCGACEVACEAGLTCNAGVCACATGSEDCGADGTCNDLSSDPINCGACGTACPEGQVCSVGACSAACAEGLENCGGSCVALGTSSNCGACGDTCDAAANETCVAGVCTVSTGLVCEAPQLDCGGDACVDSGTDNAHCGECNTACTGGTSCVAGECLCPDGQELCGNACVATGTCDSCATVRAGMISNFENQALTIIPQTGEDWDGTWETFQGADQGPPLTIEETTPPPDSCGTYALHTEGSDHGDWVGIDVTLRGTDHNAAIEYDASKWTGIRFWAKGAADNTPIRFNVSTAWTEDEDSGGECATAGSGNDWEECYNHVGKFLYDLGTEWKQYTLCFDRDLYPLFVPGYLDAEQRKQVASRILKLQWQFNNAKDLRTLDPTNLDNQGEFPKYPANSPFELWLDDVEFFEGECPEPDYSRFTGNAPFPQNTDLGTCAPVENASAYNAAILRAYETWIENLVTTEGANGGARVMSPEHDSSARATPSEAMGYGMMITAAMGDKELFDQFWTYTQSQIMSGVGLMLWLPGDSGSATDADADIAFSLLMAQAQWGGTYADAASDMIDAMYREDVTNGNVNAGSNDWLQGFNASYFTPSFYPAYGGDWLTVRDEGYVVLGDNQSNFRDGLFSDWCQLDGTPVDGSSIGAKVTGGFTGPVYGYDAARVPWRLGLDACTNGEDQKAVDILTPLLTFFADYATHQDGDRIDLLVAGWQNGGPAIDAVSNQVSFIGPVGVGAMAVSARANMREMAFRAVLDILENPEYNQTYYPTTLGLITALTMSGNLLHP